MQIGQQEYPTGVTTWLIGMNTHQTIKIYDNLGK